jgi:Mn-dependent DtxR family transcriptional regulator
VFDFTRARSYGEPDPVPIHLLTTRQRAIVEVIDSFERNTGDTCSIMTLARRLRLHHSTIQEHLLELHRKGWLTSSKAPIALRRKKI